MEAHPNRDQWQQAFVEAMIVMRPHLTGKVAHAMALQAWVEYGTGDPAAAARACHRRLETQAGGKKPRR